MDLLDNFLSSGHLFSKDKNLQKFRFSFLNIVMLIATLLVLINFLASLFGAINFGKLFEVAMVVYTFASILAFYLLRIDRKYYYPVVIYFIATSFALFYFVLLTRQEDEFRLVAFFLGVFITYVLLGKKYGLLTAVLILFSIVLISNKFDLEISTFAYSTFYSFFIIFTAFLYFFLRKVEWDAIEFQLLNTKLKENIEGEQQQRKEQEQMLLRQCRMANMGEMLDSIAHQWRQPLMHINSILLNMDNALETKEKDGKYLEDKIDEVATLTSHMSQTIEDFRGLFKNEKEFTEFTLNKVLSDVLALMKNILNNVAIENNADSDLSVMGYRSEFMQVIIILIANAVEALNNRHIKNKKILIRTSNDGNEAIITIEDNAGGINAGDINSIFDPYFTTKEQKGGTGLGLYIAKIIVEQKMGGKISVKNKESGAEFTIVINKESVR